MLVLLTKTCTACLLLLSVIRSTSFQLAHSPAHQRSHCLKHFAVDTSKVQPVGDAQEDNVCMETERQHAATVSASLLDAMRQRTATENDRPLHLATDLFDRSTGLHSEGVWHNALAGIASLHLNQPEYAQRIIDSLFEYSWDGTSFRRRAYSGMWDHSRVLLESIEQPNYYRESAEHRCVQHGMALVLWSKFVLTNKSAADSYKEQQRVLAKSFRDEFWDDTVGRWTTVSGSQGGGTLLRPSASAERVMLHVTEPTPYYRAVDQAVGVLACLAHLEVLHQEHDEVEYNEMVRIIQRSCSELLDSFGYAQEDNVRTYIGLDRNRNFWHDGWVVLALISARQYAWPTDDAYNPHGENELRDLLDRLICRYGHRNAQHDFDGTVWHWPVAQKAKDENVRYCGDNVMLYAITRRLDWAPGGLAEYQSGFWDLVAELRSREDDGLASVADVYKQVRLHPNTELAALLVWPQSIAAGTCIYEHW